MATLEYQIARLSLQGSEPAVVAVTYDDGTLRLADLIIRNPLATPINVWGVITRNDTDLYRDTVAAPGETVFNIPGNHTLESGFDDEGNPMLVLPFEVYVGAST